MNARALTPTVLVVVVLLVLVSANVTLCPLAGFFGVSCPSCGLTRAALAVLRGDFSRALAIHPGVFVVLPYLLAIAIDECRPLPIRTARGRGLGRRTFVVAGIVILVALTTFWLMRFWGAWGGPVPVRRWIESGSSASGKVDSVVAWLTR